MARELVGYLEVRVRDASPHESLDLIDIVGNEQFYLGRHKDLCRRCWPDPTISNKHLRIHCILYEEKPVANVPPFVYATDESTNGTYIKTRNPASTSSHADRGVLMGRKNGAFLLDDLDELRLSDSITLIYHACNAIKEHQLTSTQEQEKLVFSSRYLVTGRLLGTGGYGKVFVGMQERTLRQLACKIVDLRGLYGGVLVPNLQFPLGDESQESMTTGLRRRWPTKITACFREFDILQNLEHPNIIGIEKVFWSPNTVFIFEELVTGGDLFSYLEYKGGRLTDIEAAVIIRQILKGVEYLHDHDIVHRDLKPDNILLTSLEDGARIVITDFGNARFLPKSQCGTNEFATKRRMFSVAGTLEYAAPEIHQVNSTITSKQGYTKAVDMWSIGSITSALLSGDVIFTDRRDPRYEQDPWAVIMGLASKCDISIIDSEHHFIWSKVGNRPKDFIRNLLVLREEARMTATQALNHAWFSNECHAEEFEALYDRSIRDWQPRRKKSQIVERISGSLQHSAPRVVSKQAESHHSVSSTSISGVDEHPLRRSNCGQSAPFSPILEEREDLSRRQEDQSTSTGNNDQYLHGHGAGHSHHRLTYSQPWYLDSSSEQPSLNHNPLASGMYSAYNSMQTSSKKSGSEHSDVDRLCETDRFPGAQHEQCVSRTVCESLNAEEVPTSNVGSRIFTSEPESVSSVIRETPVKAIQKRPLSPESALPSYAEKFDEAPPTDLNAGSGHQAYTKRSKPTVSFY